MNLGFDGDILPVNLDALGAGHQGLAACAASLEANKNQSVSMVCRQLFDVMQNPPARRHGFRVETRIVTWRGDDVVRVPLGALFRDQGRQAVFIVKDEQALLRYVEIGQVNERQAEVKDGLAEGEIVIMHPSDLVFDGVAVVARQDGAVEP